MKIIITLALILTITMSAADETIYRLEIGESLSIHPLRDKNLAPRFKNKVINDTGIFVKNHRINLLVLTYSGDSFVKDNYLWAKDCMDTHVVGMTRTWGTSYLNKRLEIGFGIGGYAFNTSEWVDSGMPTSWVNIGTSNIGVVPVFGIDVNVKLLKIGKFEVNWNTYINPILTNSFIGIGFSF